MAVPVVQVMLDVVADEERRNLAEFQPAPPAPSEEPVHHAPVRLPGVRVADLRLEEIRIGARTRIVAASVRDLERSKRFPGS